MRCHLLLLILGIVTSTFSNCQKLSSKRRNPNTPRCIYKGISLSGPRKTSRQRNDNQFDFHCSCPTGHFTGRASNFLLGPIRSLPSTLRPGNFSILLQGCHQLKLDLNFGKLIQPSQQPGQTFKIKIQNSHHIHITNVRLAFDHHHILELEKITSKIVLTGNISCYQCANQTRSSSMIAAHSPALFSIKALKVRRLVLHGVNAQVPLKVTALDSYALLVAESRFETIPWPGFYIHNVTRVNFNHNQFMDAAPKALSAKRGTEIVIANNVLDVASAVDVSQFNHITIRCNQPSMEAPVSHSMDCSAISTPSSNFIDEFYLSIETKHKIVLWGIVAVLDVFGFFLILIAILLAILGSIVCCCCCSKFMEDFFEDDELPPEATVIVREPLIQPKLRPPILKKPKVWSEEPEKPKAEPIEKYDKYIKIDRVVQEPDQEEGVVHGQLFLTGSWPESVRRIQARPVEDEEPDTGIEGSELVPKRSRGLKKISEVRLPAGYVPPTSESELEVEEEFPVPRRNRKPKPGMTKKLPVKAKPKTISNLKSVSTSKGGTKPKATNGTKKKGENPKLEITPKRPPRESSVGRYTTV